MKIVFCLNNFLPNSIGGTEIYVYKLSKFLKDKNFDVKILIPSFAFSKKGFLEKFIYDGLEVFSYYVPDEPSDEIIKGLKRPVGLNYYKEWLLKYNPDIIHFHEISSLGFSIENIKIAKELGIVTVFTFHRISYTCFTSKLRYLDRNKCDGLMDIDKCRKCSIYDKTESILKTNIIDNAARFLDLIDVNLYSYKNKLATALGYSNYIKQGISNLGLINLYSDVIICLNNWYKNILELNGISSNKINIVKQGLMSEYKKEGLVITNVKEDRMVKLIFIGRGNKEKGLDIIIDALAILDVNYYQLDIFGPIDISDLENSLVSKIKNLNINFYGVIEPNLVLDLLKKYDFLVMASRVIEMAPLVILEAFASGISVIAPDYESIQELVDDNSKLFLFDINDKNGLKKLVKKIILDEKGILNNIKSSKIVLRDIRDVGNEMINIYKSSIKKN